MKVIGKLKSYIASSSVHIQIYRSLQFHHSHSFRLTGTGVDSKGKCEINSFFPADDLWTLRKKKKIRKKELCYTNAVRIHRSGTRILSIFLQVFL